MCILKEVCNYLKVLYKWKKYMKRKGVKGGFEEEDSWTNPVSSFIKRQKIKHRLLIAKLTTSGTLENYVFTALLGLIVGIGFTFAHFFSEIYMGKSTVFWNFLVHMPVIVLGTGLMAFTKWGRCFVMLTPLFLFSGSGSTYLSAVALDLCLEGPVENLNHNRMVLQESSHCQQRGVSAAAEEIADILFGPYSSFKQAAMEIVKGIKVMVNKMQKVLGAFKRTVMGVADAIQDAAKWINSKINGCKNTVGTTYQHCMQAFASMYDECKVSVPSVFVKMCSVTEVASHLCSSVKPGEYLCDLVYFNLDPLVTTINQRINRLWDRAYTLLSFQVDIHHQYKVESNGKSIAELIDDKLPDAVSFHGFLDLVMMLFALKYLYDIKKYIKMYGQRVGHDNYYIDNRLRTIDMLETLKGQTSIFPLRRYEKKKYTKVSSLSLINKEWKASLSQITATLKTFVILFCMGFDYLFYIIIMKCRRFSLAVMQTAGSRTEINIEGNGFIAGLSRRVLRTLNYMDYNFYSTHFMPCIPNPTPPNTWFIVKLSCILVVLWFSFFAEPYTQRYRHIVADFFYPQMADKRARWLYNKIVIKRVTFLSMMRVKLRSKYGREQQPLSIADKLRATYPWLTHIIGHGMLAETCIICTHIRPPLYRCPKRDCLGVYCDDCYINIQGVCILCKEEMMHSDFKDAHFQKVVEDKACEDEDKETAEGLFSVVDDEPEDLQFDYQNKEAHTNTLPIQPESNVEVEARYFVSDSGKNLVETVFYPVEDEEQLDGGNQPGFKYTRLHERPNTGEKFNYEDTFEMF